MHTAIPVYPKSKIVVGNVVRHRKSGGEYEILALALMEKTLEPVVVYRALAPAADDGEPARVWVRPLDEMQDGRFELLLRPAPQHL